MQRNMDGLACLLSLLLNWKCASGVDGGSWRASVSIYSIDQDTVSINHHPWGQALHCEMNLSRLYNLSGTSVSKLFLHFNLLSAVCTPAVFGELHDKVIERYKDK